MFSKNQYTLHARMSSSLTVLLQTVTVSYFQGSQHNGDKSRDEVGGIHPFEPEAARILDILRGVDNEISRKSKSSFKVLSVWGVSGVGKSALVRSIYLGQMERKYRHRWGKYAWVNVPQPFDYDQFCRSLYGDLCSVTTEDEIEYHGEYGRSYECSNVLRKHRCLVVIDGLESMETWDYINCLKLGAAKGSTIVITSKASLAIHCADSDSLVCNLKTSDSSKDQVCLFKNALIAGAYASCTFIVYLEQLPSTRTSTKTG
jgi:hypothetical protein